MCVHSRSVILIQYLFAVIAIGGWIAPLTAQTNVQSELILPIVLQGCLTPSCTPAYDAYLHVFALEAPFHFSLNAYNGSGGIANIACDFGSPEGQAGGGGASGVAFYQSLLLCLAGAQNAWARFTNFGTSTPANAIIEIDRRENARDTAPIVSTVTIPAIAPARTLSAPVVGGAGFQLNRRRSAYAIVNPSDAATASVQISAMNDTGTVLCSASLVMPPLTRVAKFFDEFLPSCNISGVLRPTFNITADIPVALGALSVTPEGHFINLPVGSRR